MSKVKQFKSYSSFWKAIAAKVRKDKQWLISSTLVQLGYAVKQEVSTPYPKVVYSAKPGVIFTEEDVDKVAKVVQSLVNFV